MSVQKLLLALAAASATALPLMPAPAPAAEPTPTLRIKPGQLDRGAAPLTPYLDGSTIVDGKVRVQAPGLDPTLIGRGGERGYLVTAEDGSAQSRRHLYVVGREGGTRLLRTNVDRDQVVANQDGTTYVVATSGFRRSTVEVGYVARDRQDIGAINRYQGPVDVLDLDGQVVALGGEGIGTRTWNFISNAEARISPRTGDLADLSADRLSTSDAEPYLGGCSRISTISGGARTLFETCEESPLAFSPGGTRVMTADLSGRSPSVNPITSRTMDGSAVRRYRVGYTFSGIIFESERTLVLGAYGADERGALVRCGAQQCRRVSDFMDLDWV